MWNSTKNLGNVFVNGSDVILLNVNNIKINTIDYQSKTLITLDSKASIINEVNKDNKTNEKTPEKPVIGEKKYTVTFDTDGGNTITKVEVIDGQKLTKPKNPVKKGYIFVRWWLKTEWFNFNNPITKDITIKAEWKSKTPAPIIKATGINMLLTKTLMSKDVFTIKGNVEPANAANQGVTYTSSDPSVATVDNNGKITAIKGGSAIITATTLDGGYKATCTVTVNPKITFEIVDLGGQSNKVMGVKAIIDGVQATTGSIKFGTETMKINSTGVANFAVIEGITKDNVNTCTYIK
ncbi:MAG: Ig-like domain-containing protein [Bacilli bacterium]